MKRFFSLSLFALNMMVCAATYAEKADSAMPTNVEADQMVYDDVRQINTFTGNVALSRGSLSMKAHKMVVTQDPSGYQTVTLHGTANTPASFRQKRDGGANLWVEGQAERIEYDGKSEMVRLFSKAQMRRLDGNKATDEVAGEFISYDSRSEFFTVSNTPSGVSKPGAGRVRVVIQPRGDAQQ